MWPTLGIAFLVALVLTGLIVWPLGWRRPGSTEEEEILISALFLFALIFLVTWAMSTWITPWGPALWDASWLMVLIIGLFVAMLVLVAAPLRQARFAGADGTAAANEAAEGFGLLFWVLIVLLLLAAVFGTTS